MQVRTGQARALFAEGLLPCEFDYGHHVAEAAFAAKGAACALAPCKGIKQGRNGCARRGDFGRARLAVAVRFTSRLASRLTSLWGRRRAFLFTPQGYDGRCGSLPGTKCARPCCRALLGWGFVVFIVGQGNAHLPALAYARTRHTGCTRLARFRLACTGLSAASLSAASRTAVRLASINLTTARSAHLGQ